MGRCCDRLDAPLASMTCPAPARCSAAVGESFLASQRRGCRPVLWKALALVVPEIRAEGFLVLLLRMNGAPICCDMV